MRRGIAVLLSGVLMLTGLAVPAWAEEGKPSTNVPPSATGGVLYDTIGHWAENVIWQAYDLKIVNGYEDGSFQPDKTITREEFFTLITNILTDKDKFDLSGVTISFSDVEQGAWYEKTIKLALAARITSGYTDGTFGIGKNITREEAAKVAGSVISTKTQNNEASSDEAPFAQVAAGQRAAQAKDYSDISSWAKTYVDLLYEKGYMSGDDSGYFRPQASLTRAEATKILFNIFMKEDYIGPAGEDQPGNNNEEEKPLKFEANDCTLIHGETDYVFAEGNGSKANPYKIYTQYQLDHIREHLGDGSYFRLENDIVITDDLAVAVNKKSKSAADWTKGNFEPLGSDKEAFNGVFLGNNFSIKKLWIQGTESKLPASYAGLFGMTAEKAIISNLTIEDSIIIGGRNTGGIVGDNKGEVTESICGPGTEVTGTSNVGGIAGLSSTPFVDCINQGVVEGTSNNTGGIVGSMSFSGVAVDGCTNEGTVIGADKTGGIIGSITDKTDSVTISNCVNAGKVECASFIGAGIVGYAASNFSSVNITDCKNTGHVTGNGIAAGIVGTANDSKVKITNCVNFGTVAGGGGAGGIAGNNAGTVSLCYNQGIVVSQSNAGGIAANNQSLGRIIQSYNNGEIESINFSGGIAGDNSGQIRDSYNSSSVTAENAAGGITGKNSGSILSVYNCGDVKGLNGAGALVGRNSGSVEQSFWLMGSADSVVGMTESQSLVSAVRSVSQEQLSGQGRLYTEHGYLTLVELLNSYNSSSSGFDQDETWVYLYKPKATGSRTDPEKGNTIGEEDLENTYLYPHINSLFRP